MTRVYQAFNQGGHEGRACHRETVSADDHLLRQEGYVKSVPAKDRETYLFGRDERDLLSNAIPDDSKALLGARAHKGVGGRGEQVGLNTIAS